MRPTRAVLHTSGAVGAALLAAVAAGPYTASAAPVPDTVRPAVAVPDGRTVTGLPWSATTVAAASAVTPVSDSDSHGGDSGDRNDKVSDKGDKGSQDRGSDKGDRGSGGGSDEKGSDDRGDREASGGDYQRPHGASHAGFGGSQGLHGRELALGALVLTGAVGVGVQRLRRRSSSRAGSVSGV